MSPLPKKHRPNSLRLPEYDYSQSGGYYVTICTHEKIHILSTVVDGGVKLSEYGEVVRECWLVIPDHFEHITLDMVVIMPNHIHGIIFIHDKPNNNANSVRARHVSLLQPQSPPSSKANHSIVPTSLGTIIGSFKASVTRTIRRQFSNNDNRIWQRGFYDHIIRDEDDLRRIQQYIHDNPLKWESDDYYECKITSYSKSR